MSREEESRSYSPRRSHRVGGPGSDSRAGRNQTSTANTKKTQTSQKEFHGRKQTPGGKTGNSAGKQRTRHRSKAEESKKETNTGRTAKKKTIRKRKKQIFFQKLLLVLLVPGLLAGLTVLFLHRNDTLPVEIPEKIEQGTHVINENVEAYRPLVESIAPEYGLEEYVDLILAVIMQESSGVGTDIMSSSESGYNTLYSSEPGSIEDPAYSIRCGLSTLSVAMDKAEVRSPEDIRRIAIALQGYNFGINGYLDYVKEHHITAWTRETAEEFARMASGEILRSPDNSFAETAGPWDYGDQRYPEHVLRYYP